MSILRVEGTLTVEVDEVEIEQVCIEHPKLVEGFPVGLQAMAAAFMKDDIKALQREMFKCHHTIEYVQSEKVDEGWLIDFKIRAKEAHERVAGDV